MKPTIVTRVGASDAAGPYAVYIGRPRHNQPWRWGNPFAVGIDGTRQEVIDKFRDWVQSEDPRAQWMRWNIHRLKGKTLVCFCKPSPCHGDILAKLADKS